MSSHLVETSEEDSFTAVSRFIGDLLNNGQERTELADTPGSKYTADCQSLVAEARYGELLDRWLAQIELLLAKAQDKDLECCINIVCHLVSRVPPPLVASAAHQVAAALTAKVDFQPDARLAGLSELYNVLTDAGAQLAVLTELLKCARRPLKYGAAAGRAHVLVPVIQSGAESWPTELQLSPVQTRDLLLLCADVLRSSQRKKVTAERDAYKLTLRTLETLDEGASREQAAPLKAAAATAAAAFLRSTEVYQFDLLDCPAVAQLRGDPQHGPLHELLSIMLSGDVQSFEAFAGGNSDMFEAVGCSQEEALLKMRLMALLGLASRAATIGYLDIQSALCIPESEVESWVVCAIGKKLLEARIDQLRHTVTVTRAAHRSFGFGQWQELRSQLSVWADNVAGVRQLVASQELPGSLPQGLADGVRV